MAACCCVLGRKKTSAGAMLNIIFSNYCTLTCVLSYTTLYAQAYHNSKRRKYAGMLYLPVVKYTPAWPAIAREKIRNRNPYPYECFYTGKKRNTPIWWKMGRRSLLCHPSSNTPVLLSQLYAAAAPSFSLGRGKSEVCGKGNICHI